MVGPLVGMGTSLGGVGDPLGFETFVMWGPHRVGALVGCCPRWLGPWWGGAFVEWGTSWVGILVRWVPHRMGANVECCPRWLGPSWGLNRVGALMGWGPRGALVGPL